MKMTEYQRMLVESHLGIVEKTIRKNIQINNRILQTYEDFYAVGCEALCKAAILYNPNNGEFGPLAATVIRNALLDYCRIQNVRANSTFDMKDDEEDCGDLFDKIPYEDHVLEDIYSNQLNEILNEIKNNYSGISRKGVEAILMKSRGMSSEQIACHFDTTINNVNAWISRARSKLKKEEKLLSILA